MKKRKTHQFLLYSSHFNKDSMIKEVAKWANHVFNKDSDNAFCYLLASKEKYLVYINKYPVRGTALIVQTWLIDMIYDIACLRSTGNKIITPNEALHLIDLYNDYLDKKDKDYFPTKKKFFTIFIWFFWRAKKVSKHPRILRHFCKRKIYT